MPRALFNDSGSQALVPTKVGSVTHELRLEDIRIVASCENYTEVALAKTQRLLVRRTMKQWTKLLPAEQFARVHRGLLVNLDRIGRIERGAQQSTKVHFAGDDTTPLEIKRRHWPALRARLESWRSARRLVSSSPIAVKSVAVLPFANLSREASNEIFCDGVSEELLNVLAKIPGLRVAARTSAFYFKGRNESVSEIARQLGVAFVVEGSVRKSGHRVRITAQLINAADGFHVWSDNFDRELTDIFAVQDDIAGLIAVNLQLKLSHAIRATPIVNLDAHWLTLEGRHFWNLRTSDGFTRSEAAFGRALAIDPNSAQAHAGLADVHNIRALYRLADGAIDVSDDLSRSRVEALRALQLDPDFAEARATLGFVCFHEGRLDEAERELQQAFAANPNYATGLQFYSWTLCAQGRLDRALEEYSNAIALDPLSFINVDRYAAMLALAGNFSEALIVNERAAALRPDVFVGNLSQRAPILFALGRRDEAVAAARSVRKIARELPYRRNSDADALFVLQQSGFTEEASDYAAEILPGLAADNYVRGFVLAAVGRFAEAIPCLERTPTIMLPQLYWSPLWDGARKEIAFEHRLAQLKRVNEYRLARVTLARMREAEGSGFI